MRELLEVCEKAAQAEHTTILILGESGTGKGVLAKALHYNSPRAQMPLLELNCAAMPDTLLESELFGYEPGAFTDARRRKEGLLERAQGGTVFLDEIGNMSASVQAKVLRVLEEGTFMRLGGTRPHQGGRAHHRRHQQRSEGSGGARAVPRRPVLPPQRAADHAAAAARAHARTSCRWPSAWWSASTRK